MLPLRAATIGEGWTDALAPAMLHAVLYDTDVGKAWIAQAGAVVLLVAAAALPSQRRQGALTFCSGLLLVTLTISGHAAMNDGWLRTLHRINDGIHLLSGGAWLGALGPVLLVLRMLHSPRWHTAARIALVRFSTAGHAAVALVILSGILNTALIIRAVPSDWAFTYQLLLSVKILLVSAMVALAVVNRYVFVPRLGTVRSLAALKSGTTAEICLGLAVVGLVAWFGNLQPT